MSNTVACFHPVSWLLKLVPGFSEGLKETKNTEKKQIKIIMCPDAEINRLR